jgi:hypothetical protein
MTDAADVTGGNVTAVWSQFVSTMSAVDPRSPLVAFYDIYE